MRVTCWLEQLANKEHLTSCGLRPQEGATFFFTGVPMFGNPLKQVGLLAQHVRVTHRLNKESRQPGCDLRLQKSCD